LSQGERTLRDATQRELPVLELHVPLIGLEEHGGDSDELFLDALGRAQHRAGQGDRLLATSRAKSRRRGLAIYGPNGDEVWRNAEVVGQELGDGGRLALALKREADLHHNAAEAIDASVVDMRFAKPVDAALAADMARTHELLVTVEEHAVQGGAGSAVAEALAARAICVPMLHLGLPDSFIDHGDAHKLLARMGLDGAGIVKSIRARLCE